VKPILLDLFCCEGGAGKGYSDAGWDVFGVDKDPQPLYPFWFHQGDALEVAEVLLSGGSIEFTKAGVGTRALTLTEVAAGHGSPPCQSFTAYRRRGSGVGDSYANLIPETRSAFKLMGIPYVIENVPGAPLEGPVQFCGSSFGLDVRRHRLFESNIALNAPPCDHAWQTPRFPPATNRSNLRRTVEVGVWRIPLEVQRRAMGIGWMTLRGLSEAIPPAYTEFIGQQLLEHLRAAA